MGDDKIAPGTVRDERRDERVVEEPVGFDNPPTERIPAQGDLSDGQTSAEPQADRLDEPQSRLDETPDEPVELEPVMDSTELVAEPVTGSGKPETAAGAVAGTFDGGDVTRFQERWRELQSDFVDDPAGAVRGADGLVDEIIRELAQRKQGLEEQWRDRPDDTEGLRVAMREYRSFFNQLLNA
jgi:hypothetical protein